MNIIKKQINILNNYLQKDNKFSFIKYNYIIYNILKLLYKYDYIQNIQYYKINKLNYILIEFKFIFSYKVKKLKFKLIFTEINKYTLNKFKYNKSLIIVSTSAGIMSSYKAILMGLDGIILWYIN